MKDTYEQWKNSLVPTYNMIKDNTSMQRTSIYDNNIRTPGFRYMDALFHCEWLTLALKSSKNPTIQRFLQPNSLAQFNGIRRLIFCFKIWSKNWMNGKIWNWAMFFNKILKFAWQCCLNLAAGKSHCPTQKLEKILDQNKSWFYCHISCKGMGFEQFRTLSSFVQVKAW